MVSTRAYLEERTSADLTGLQELIRKDPRLLAVVYLDTLDVASNNLEGPSCGHSVLHLAITGAMFEHSQLRELSDSPTRFLCIKGDGLVGRTHSTLAPGTPANNALFCTAFNLPLGIGAPI